MIDLRIVFMGTSDFAVTILKKLLDEKYTIVGVVTIADKPAGRGRKLKESAVKKFALKNNLNLLQPTDLKSPLFLKELKALQSNLQIVVAFRIIPKIIWNLPEFGTFNLHASLLPYYRGAAPIHWAIMNGETKTGVTTFFLDDKVDTGEIILQKETTIGENETVGELYYRLMNLGSNLVTETISLIQKGNVSTKVQHSKTSKLAYKINTATRKIDWEAPLNTIFNKIRGLNPHPVAWSYLYNNGEEIYAKIYDVKKSVENHTYSIGKIISDKKTIKVAVKGGYIFIDSLQLSGKKKMDTHSLLNGFVFQKDAKMI